MHETIIAKQIIDMANKQGNVKSITVEIGDLAHLPAKDIETTLKGMVDWKIIIINKKAKVKCTCGYVGEPHIIEHGHDYTLFECPVCKSVPEILEGKDIILKQVEIE